MRMSNCRNNSPRECVRNLIAVAQKKYEKVVNLWECLDEVKDLYVTAQWNVNSLSPAPVVNSLEDLPTDFKDNFFKAALITNDSVNSLKQTTINLIKTYFNVDESVYSSIPISGEVVDDDLDTNSMTDEVPSTKRFKTDDKDDEDYRGETVKDITTYELKAMRDNYEMARQIIMNEMAECNRLVRLVMKGVHSRNAEAIKGEVHFNTGGKLVCASKAALLEESGTFFYGLLNKGAWLMDAIGAYPIDDDPDILNLVLLGITDKQSFYKKVNSLDDSSRAYLDSRLDFYNVDITIFRDVKVDSSINIKSVANDFVTLVRDCHPPDGYRGAIWDPSITTYSITVEASSNMCVMVGFAPYKLFDVSRDNCTCCGWYLFLHYGILYAQGGINKRPYSSGVQVGDTITCTYSAESKEICFYKNGESLGVAYSDVVGDAIAPAVELYHFGDSISLKAY